jgi:hypothetical protein
MNWRSRRSSANSGSSLNSLLSTKFRVYADPNNDHIPVRQLNARVTPWQWSIEIFFWIMSILARRSLYFVVNSIGISALLANN